MNEPSAMEILAQTTSLGGRKLDGNTRSAERYDFLVSMEAAQVHTNGQVGKKAVIHIQWNITQP